MAETTAKNVHTADSGLAGVISKISLPKAVTGGDTDLVYEIHDAKAIHSAEDLGLSAALRYLGTKATYNDLPTTDNKNGDVWHVTADEYEYVWNGTAWEELGAPHDFIGTKEYNDHGHLFTPGKVTIPSLTASGSINVDKYKADTKVLSAESTAPGLTGSSPQSVIKSNAKLTVSAVQAVTTTPATISAEGTPATWTATVNGGVLAFAWTTNTPTKVEATVVGAVTANPETLDVSVPAGDVTSINTSWTAGAPTISLKSQTSTGTGTIANGQVSVATGISTDGTKPINISATTTAKDANVTGAQVLGPTPLTQE